MKHRLSVDTDRCVCGGEWVYFDDEGTHGCDVDGPPEGIVYDHFGRIVWDEEEDL